MIFVELWLGANAALGLLILFWDWQLQWQWRRLGRAEDRELLRAARRRDPERFNHMDTGAFALTLKGGPDDFR